MVKKILLFVIFFAASLMAQEIQRMFDDYEKYDRTGYFTTDLKFSNLNNAGTNMSTIFYGAGGGLQFDSNYYVGGALYTSTSNFLANGDITTNGLSLTYGGGVLGIVSENYESMHLVLNGLLGLGYAYDSTASTGDLVIVIEPELGLEFNVTNFTKLKLGWSWRITQGVDAAHASNGLFGSSWFAGYGDFFSINFGITLGEY